METYSIENLKNIASEYEVNKNRNLRRSQEEDIGEYKALEAYIKQLDPNNEISRAIERMRVLDERIRSVDKEIEEDFTRLEALVVLLRSKTFNKIKKELADFGLDQNESKEGDIYHQLMDDFTDKTLQKALEARLIKKYPNESIQRLADQCDIDICLDIRSSRILRLGEIFKYIIEITYCIVGNDIDPSNPYNSFKYYRSNSTTFYKKDKTQKFKQLTETIPYLKK